MAKLVNIADYVSGDTLVMTFTVKDAQGVAVDLTSASGEWVILERSENRVAPPVEKLSLLSTGGSPKVTFPNPTGGVCQVRLEAGVFPLYGEFEHQLKITIAGDIETVARGRFHALQSV
jgi:hypothetical protein